jgi:hypothetical protein
LAGCQLCGYFNWGFDNFSKKSSNSCSLVLGFISSLSMAAAIICGAISRANANFSPKSKLKTLRLSPYVVRLHVWTSTQVADELGCRRITANSDIGLPGVSKVQQEPKLKTWIRRYHLDF